MNESYPNFAASELYNPHWTDHHEMDVNFMEKVQDFRYQWGRAMILLSAWRTPEHNAEIGGSKNSWHMKGRAIDTKVTNVITAGEFVALAIECGFTGIGIHQTGQHSKRFIHLDDGHELLSIWTY